MGKAGEIRKKTDSTGTGGEARRPSDSFADDNSEVKPERLYQRVSWLASKSNAISITGLHMILKRQSAVF
jgi:hypothetical protein